MGEAEGSKVSKRVVAPGAEYFGSRLPYLDALRFLAATIVLVDHGGFHFSSGDGVMFFLVLSGFLFTWLFCAELEKTGTIDIKRFYVRRFMRLMPAFWVACLFTVLVTHLRHGNVNWAHLVSSVCFYANYYNAFHDHPSTGFDIYWTLSLQEQFYILWPFLFLALMKRTRRAAVVSLVAAITAVCGYRWYLYSNGLTTTAYLYNAFELRVDTILIGALTAIVVRYSLSRECLKSMSRKPYLPLGTLILLVLYRLFIARNYRYGWGWTLHGFLIALLIVQLMTLRDSRYWRWLDHRLIRAGGTISYSMYLYHLWGLAIGAKLTMLPLAGRILVGFVATVFFAIPSYLFIERSGMRLRSRVTSDSRKSSLPS